MADSPLRPRSSYIPPAGVDPLRPSGDLFFEEDLVRATLPETADARRGLAQAFAAAASGHHSGAALKAEAAGDAALQQQALRQAELADRQAELYAPRVSSLRDAQSIGDVGSFIAGAAPGVVADTLPALGAALLTRGRWKPAAFAGATVPSYHQQFGEMAREQRLDPTLSEASAEDRLRSARLGAAGGSLLEALLPGKLANEALRGSSRSLLRNTAVDALTEGVTETAQTGVQHLAHRTIDPTRELDGWDLVDSAVGGAAGGGGLGAASRAPSHVANALFGRARPVRNDAGDPQPGADVAPPGTPLLPAPDGGSGGGVGGLYDTLNERFGDGIRDRARKTKDYVSDTIDRMGEAAKTAETPQDFLRQVFGNSAEEAAADLRPDTEDPVVLNAPDPAAALQQRDAQRQERAALFAAELLNDPATPESVKERVASFGGDFSNPEAQAFVARNLVAQRAGEKLANAVSDLFDLTKDFGGKAAETGTDLASKARDMIDKSMSAATDRIVKKNLQGINEADVAPLVRLLAQRLGPALAGDAPKLARQLVAAANRLSPDARITEETDRRLRNFSAAIDDEVLDLVTELSGSDALRNTIAKIRSIPSAASDVRQSGGYSFLESMLKQPLEPAVLSQLSEFVDALGLQLGSMSSERKNQVLAALALAFGSKREAQIVVEYYGNIRRDAFRLEAEADTLADDRPLDDDAPGEVVATLENPDGTVSYGAEFGSLTEQDAAEMTASYRDPNPARPFFRATDRAALRDARRAAPPGSRVATLREYVAQTGENPKAVAARVRQDLRKRLTDAENRDTATVQEAIASMEAVPEAERSEDFNALLSQLKARKTENRTDLPGLRKQMEAIEKASGVSFNEIADLSRRIRRAELADEGGIDNGDIANLPALRKQLAKLEDRYAKNAERVLEKYAVVMRPKDETFANDELMAKFRGLLDKLPNANVGTPAERAKKREAIAKIKKTAIKFNRKGSKTPITLSAESMAYASQARGSMEERFLDSLAAVLARPDIEGLVPPAPDTLISRRTGLTWGDIAPEKPTDNRTERQKRAQREKDTAAAWAKQERMRLDIETWPKLMAALRDVQRRFLADRLGLTLAPDEAISLTDLIDRFPPAQRGAMRTEANEAAFQSALGWAKKLSRKLATATERNYADESRMRVLEKYIDEQLNDRFPIPEGDERASHRLAAENQAAGVHADEGGIGGAILDAEAEIEMLEERLDAVEGIDGLTRKYERRVEEAQTELDRLADSVGSPEQRDVRVPGPRQNPRDAGRTDKPKPGKGPARTEVRSTKGGTETVMTVRAAIRSLFNTALDNVVVVRRTAQQLFEAAGIDPANLPAGVLFSYSDTQKSADASVRDFATYINTKLDADGLPYITKETRTDDDVNAIATKFLDAVKKDPRLLINPVNSEKLSVSQYLTDEETGEAIDPNDLSQHWRLTDIGRHVASAVASGRISDILTNEATRITEGRESAIVDLIRALDESGVGTPVERARVVIAASKYATSGTYSPTSGEVRVRADTIGDNRHGVTVDEAIAKEVIKELRAGKGMKAAMKAATVTSVEAARRSNAHANTTGWVEFKKGSSPEVLNKAMNGTGWCTGFTDISHAAIQISQGSFWAYYEDGEPQIGIRTENGRLGEPPRGRLEGQRLSPKYAKIAADFLEKGDKVTGGEEFLQERRRKLALRELLAAKGEISPEQFRDVVMVTVGRDGEATFGVANGKAYGAEDVVFPESRIPPQFREAIGAMENAAAVSFNGASLPRELRVIRGSLLSDALTSAPELREVGGGLIANNLESAPELREVRGDLHAYNLTSAPKLERVGKDLYAPTLTSAPKLERVGSILRADALESAPELREVGGHLNAEALESARKLERVGGDMHAPALTSAPELREVDRGLITDALTSAPKLERVGESLYAANLASAPELREVGRSLYADALKSAHKLERVGENMHAPALKSAPKLELVGMDLYADALESAPELREVGGALYGDALTHAPKLSAPLDELRNRNNVFLDEEIPFSRDASGRVQGFVYKQKAYLAADNIERNRARGVLMHELGEHLGDLRGLLGDANYDKLFKAVEGWANSAGKEGEIARAAIRRAKESGNYEAELLAYAIEEAVNAGVKPTAEGVVGKWLEAVMNAFKAALKRLTGADMNLTAQDLVDLAHGAALRGPIREMRAESRGQGARVVLPSTSPYTAKDQAKSDRANKFIGRGAPGSSTAAYAEAWGDRANTGVYASDDTVFISVNGNRRGALTPPWAEIKKAMSAGATLITDTPADRARNFNTGERAVADFLSSNGYVESAPGTWTPRNAPKSSQGKVVKKSFVGAKADPEGAARAQKALGEAVVGDKPDATAADIDAATTRAELMYMLRHRRIPQSLFARFRQRSEDINSRVQGAAQAELRQSMVDGGIRKYVRVGFAEVLEQAESVKDAKNAYDALVGLQGFLPPALREIADKYLSGFKAELEGTKFSLRDRRTGLPNALSEHVLAEFSMGGDIELTVIGRHIAEEAYVRAMGEPRSGISPAYAVLHEITHALTVLREATDPVFRAETRRLYDATAKALTREQSEKFVYAMADTQEFLAEAMANPAFREVLRGIRDSGKSVLDRLMDAVRKTLGLRQSEQSLLSSVEELVYGQPPVSASVTKKNSFVGAKADPQGAADAEGLLRVGAPADVVWRELGWFRGPDGKLRKEIRSPVLRRRVRELATAIANGSRDAVAVSDLLAGIDAFKPYLAELGDLPVDPNDGMVELMGAVGAYNAEDGFSSRGIGISRLNAELAVRADAVPGGKGTALIREIVGNLNPPELADTGLSFVDPTDIIAELEARHPMPDVNERVTEYLTGTILHELQHAFQHVEGFENGGNATTAVIAKYGDVDEYLAAVRDGDEGTVERITEQAFAQLRAEVGPDGDMEAAAHELYESIVGEVEANDVAARMNLSDEEARTVAPALTDAKREFVRSVLLAEALSAVRGLHSATSKVGGRPGRPGKNWGDKAAVKAEILRLRGKDVKVRIEKLVKDLGGSGQYTYDRATGERLIEVAINAASPLGTARHEAMHDLFRFLSKDPATRSIAKDLRDATSAPHVITRLRELLKDHKGALEQLSDPEERAAYAYQFWAEGLLRIGPTGTGVFHTIRKFLKDLFGIVTAGQRGEDLMRAFHDGKFADPSTVQEVLQDLNDANGDRLRNKMERAAPALVKATRAVFTPAVDRLRSFENDSLNELADKFFSDTGRSGFIQNKYQQEGVWMNRLAALLRGTTAAERREAIEQLQAMAPKSPLAKALAKYNKDIYEYMRDAGVKSWDSQKKAFVPLREVQNYFTRSWDADAIARNRAEFEALLRKEGGVSATNAAALADNLARGTEARPGPKEEGVDLGYMPYAPHTSERVLTFINQSNAQAFAKFQHKDLADIMTMYTRSAVHRAEYAREFGNNGERIVALVKSSGVRGKDALTEISNSVQALEGSLDPGKWSPETKQFMAGMQTLQNVVVLPLALASQMIDPIVLAARSGDIRDAGRAYATALLRLKNTITKSNDGVVGEDLAKILGIVSEDSTLQAMAMAYGTTRMSKRMEAINRVFFRYNGMQGWNDSMRIAATAAGERYLLANKRNAAALAELDLTSKDIKVDKNGRLDVSSPKVQQAMFRFVDQAVLRPSPAQRPVWMSDPRFLLVAHLKQFTFAMHNVVLKRANRELSAGNPKPWATLMLAMPVMLAADMAKFALTGSFPSTWGFKDYLMHAVERSGLLGLGDFGVQAMSGVGMGKAPGEELLGPSFEHLMELLRWIGGDPRTDFGDVIDRTVPGARFI